MSQSAVQPMPAALPRKSRDRVAPRSSRHEAIFWSGLFILHAALALAMSRSEMVGFVHSYATAAIGLLIAARGGRLDHVAYVAAYIAGSEVLWRMNDAGFFWEGGKYAISGVFLVAMARNGLMPRVLPVLYFLLLIPSAFLTAADGGFWTVRGMISSTLSGPFALMVCACFFSRVKLTPEHLQRFFLTFMVAAVGLGALTLYSTLSSEMLVFGTESNETTSGGFGPNQVSSMLGLGALFGFLLLIKTRASFSLKAVALVATVFLAAQSAMTFSRGGLYNAAFGILLAAPFLLGGAHTRRRFVISAALIALLGVTVVVPQLASFTGGAVLDRFADTDTTRRWELIVVDFQIFLDNPALGVGPGRSKEAHGEYLERGYSTHTEFSRLAAEHGVFGIVALLLLLVMGAVNLLRGRNARSRAMVAAMFGWSFVYMTNAAMRLVAPSLAIGLSFATLLAEGESEAPRGRRRLRPMLRRRASLPRRRLAGAQRRGPSPVRSPR